MVSRAAFLGLSTTAACTLFLVVVYALGGRPSPADNRSMGPAAREVVGEPGHAAADRDNAIGTRVTVTSVPQFAFATAVSRRQFEHLRVFVGSVHHWHPGVPVVVYSRDLNRTELKEARNWDHTEVVEMYDILRDRQLSDDDWAALAIHDAAELFGAVMFVPVDYTVHKPLVSDLQTLFRQGFVMAGGAMAEDGASRPEVTRCCNPRIVGFVENSTAYLEALLPAATCAVTGTCRGRVAEFMLDRLSGAASALSSARCPCVCGCNLLADSLRRPDLSSESEEAWEYVDFLRERDVSLVHRIDIHSRHATPSAAGNTSADAEHTGGHEEHGHGDTAAEGKDTHSHGRSPVHKDGRTALCILVPSTTRGRSNEPLESNADGLPLFTVLMRSLLNTAQHDLSSGRFSMTLYLGVDIGDPIYDNAEHMDRVRSIFHQLTADYHMHMVVKKFGPEFRGAPAWFWNGLFQEAYQDGCDYFYQLNDDIELMSPNWATRFADALQNNPRRPNLGMAGPQDVGNQKTMTQSFCHRTHYEIFETYYPTSLKNWYSDDWATHIYDGVGSTFWLRDVQIRNSNIKGTRYTECGACEGLYLQELEQGRTRLRQWLDSHPA